MFFHPIFELIGHPIFEGLIGHPQPALSISLGLVLFDRENKYTIF